MTDERMTPEEFARLMSLPESHHDRAAAERRAEFAAMKALYAEFEAAEPALSPSEGGRVRAELARRVEARLRAVGTNARAADGASSGGIFGFLAWLSRPAPRVGLAFAALALVAGIGWWSTTRPKGPEMIRGEKSAAFEALEPHATSAGVEVRWPAAPGAEAYRVVLLGADLAELASFDAGARTEFTLNPDSLPAGVKAGDVASFEVQALRNGELLATTPARSIRFP